jgi:hypothetical protein
MNANVMAISGVNAPWLSSLPPRPALPRRLLCLLPHPLSPFASPLLPRSRESKKFKDADVEVGKWLLAQCGVAEPDAQTALHDELLAARVVRLLHCCVIHPPRIPFLRRPCLQDATEG